MKNFPCQFGMLCVVQPDSWEPCTCPPCFPSLGSTGLRPYIMEDISSLFGSCTCPKLIPPKYLGTFVSLPLFCTEEWSKVFVLHTITHGCYHQESTKIQSIRHTPQNPRFFDLKETNFLDTYSNELLS
jgi:hypothetical protein